MTTTAAAREYTHALEISFTNDLGVTLAAVTCIAKEQTVLVGYDARGVLAPCPLCTAAL